VNQRDARGRGNAPHPAEVDAGGVEAGQRVSGERIVADGAGQGDLRAGAPRGQRLIGAFAALEALRSGCR
jgi:hypothetical protein